MEDVNKNRNVTVYDICMYRSCNHGRYTTGHHLYRFPDGRKNPELLKEWVFRSGNRIRLRHWAASSIRNDGLCPDHFEADMFQDTQRIAPDAAPKLKKHAVPIKFEKSTEVHKGHLLTANASSILNLLNKKNKDMNVQINATVFDQSKSPIEEKQDYHDNDNRIHLLKISIESATNNNARHMPLITPANKNVMKNVESNSSERPLSIQADTKEVIINSQQKLTLPDCDGSTKTGYLERPPTVPSEPESEIIKVTMLKRENQLLLKDLKLAKEKCSSLQQQLQRARTSRDNYRSAVQYYKHESIDDYLDRCNCTNPVARAMIKLQLHKSKAEYTTDEKELVKDIFYHSISAFKYLRKTGCKMPGESTVKRWIQEFDDIYDYSNYILSDNDDDDDDEHVIIDEIVAGGQLDAKVNS